MITAKLHGIHLLPQMNQQPAIVASLTNGAMFVFVGVGMQRAKLTEYDALNWRDVLRAQSDVQRGTLAQFTVLYPYWEALPPVPGTDAYDDDIKQHGVHPSELPSL